MAKKPPNKGFKRSEKEWEESIAGHIGKFVDKLTLDEITRVSLFLTGTVVAHNLNLAGIVTWFGKENKDVETGLPYPFNKRIRFPWERGKGPTWEDRITEWALPALMSWILIYHPEALAKFVDALIPF